MLDFGSTTNKSNQINLLETLNLEPEVIDFYNTDFVEKAYFTVEEFEKLPIGIRELIINTEYLFSNKKSYLFNHIALNYLIIFEYILRETTISFHNSIKLYDHNLWVHPYSLNIWYSPLNKDYKKLNNFNINYQLSTLVSFFKENSSLYRDFVKQSGNERSKTLYNLNKKLVETINKRQLIYLRNSLAHYSDNKTTKLDNVNSIRRFLIKEEGKGYLNKIIQKIFIELN